MIASTVMPVGCEGSSGPSPRSDASAGMVRRNASSNSENVRKCDGPGWNFIRMVLCHYCIRCWLPAAGAAHAIPPALPLWARLARLDNGLAPPNCRTRASHKKEKAKPELRPSCYTAIERSGPPLLRRLLLPGWRLLLRSRLSLLLWLRSRTLLRSRLSLLLLWLRSRTLLRSRLSLLLRLWLRSRTLLRSRLSLLLRPWLRSRTLLRCGFSLLLWPWLRSRTLLRRRFS